MKNLLAAFLLFPIALTAQQQFSITGNLEGLPEGSAVSLSNANNPEDTVARAVVNKGVFELKGSVQEPNLYQLNLDGVKKKSVLFIGNDKVGIKGNAQAPQDFAVTGSPVHDDFEAFKKIFNPMLQQLTGMGQQLSNMQQSQRGDSLLAAYNEQLARVKAAVDDYVSSHRKSPVAPFAVLVTGQMEQDLSALERRYAQFDPAVQNGFFGKIVKQQIDNGKMGAVGSEAIDFSQATPDGKQVSLSSFRGKYVLVDFWASWCKPCRMENPNVVKAFQKYKDRNFTVLGVSLDNNSAAWVKAIKADNLAWTQVSDLKGWGNEAAAKYKVEGIPFNILVDPSGKIVAKNLRGPELDAQLEKLLTSK